MNNFIIGLLGGASVFFFISTLVLMSTGRRKTKQRLEGIKGMIDKALEEKGPRIEQFNEIEAIATSSDKEVSADILIEVETAFYEELSDVIYEPVSTNIKKVPKLVTQLVTPYFTIIDKASQMSGGNNEELEALEKRYQEKIEENEALNERLSEVKSQGGEALSDEGGSDEAKALLIEMISALAEKTEQTIDIDNNASIDTLKELYQSLKAALDGKLAGQEETDAAQFEELIAQLRQEKVSSIKKYKRSMALLVKYYQEYANTNGLVAKVEPSMEIDEFEKVIEQESESE